MTDTTTPATPEIAGERPVPTPRAYTDQADVHALLDAQFAWAKVAACQWCGRMCERNHCHPCMSGNSPPLHGYVPAAPSGAGCAGCADTLAVNRALVRKVQQLQAHCSALAAQVRAGRGG